MLAQSAQPRGPSGLCGGVKSEYQPLQLSVPGYQAGEAWPESQELPHRRQTQDPAILPETNPVPGSDTCATVRTVAALHLPHPKL